MNRLAAALILLLSAQFVWAQKSAPAPTEKTFIGSEMCGVCHEDIGKAFLKSPHEAVEKGDKHGFTGKACESCHGPGSKHAETLSPADIRNPSKISTAETDRVCMACHNNQTSNTGRINASHARNSISCTACHSMHAHGTDGLVARKPAALNTLCESCHIDVKAAFTLPFKHPVLQNAMTCVDCHNPHGAIKAPLLRLANANELGCFNCHADKRGPFTFEHAVVRQGGCEGCHMPHGSANAKMLIREEVRLVCLECHANLPSLPTQTASVRGVVPPAFHDLTSPRFRNCTICHQKIHGSHVDRNLLR
jgi:DmsE family decaheme c-type cytochrome